MKFSRLTATPHVIQRLILSGCAVAALTACDTPRDYDLRGLTDAFSTAPAALEATTVARPTPDSNGVISYPNYQVAVARKGDTINTVAARLGLPASELSRYNGIPENVSMLNGEVVALPYRVGETNTAVARTVTPTGTIASGERINVTTLANEALSEPRTTAVTTSTNAAATPITSTSIAPASDTTTEPVRHQVKRGETAYSIARTYGVSVRALSDWNGIGSDLAVQEGRYLLIPVKSETEASAPPAAQTTTTTPGAGSVTPTPPSAATALPPVEEATPEPVAPAAPAPDLGTTQSSSAEMTKPVPGPIIRDYNQTTSRFMLFSAPAGTTVKAAKAGTVKLISTNADGVQIVVVDHGGGLQTAYSFIDDLTVEKGDTVSKGQAIAKVTDNEFNALQFMVFKGTQTVDPTPYLN